MAGLIHIYCGDGKGKTTAAMGLALRAAGSGRRVLVLQFLKDGKSSEIAPLSRVEGVEVVPQTKQFGFSWTLDEAGLDAAKEYYTGLLRDAAARAGEFDLMVLDEAIGAIGAYMLDKDVLLQFLDNKPQELEVVMTGRGPSEELVSRADYVTEMVKQKHPFDQGISARKGIEF